MRARMGAFDEAAFIPGRYRCSAIPAGCRVEAITCICGVKDPSIGGNPLGQMLDDDRQRVDVGEDWRSPCRKLRRQDEAISISSPPSLRWLGVAKLPLVQAGGAARPDGSVCVVAFCPLSACLVRSWRFSRPCCGWAAIAAGVAR